MPIRFRCSFCNQLMAIARRKAGSVVRCPKCAEQLVVPDVPGTPDEGEKKASETKKPHGGELFERDNISQILKEHVPEDPPSGDEAPQQQFPVLEYDVEPLAGPIDMRGVFLTPGLLVLAGILVAVLMGAAFLVGWVVGRG